MLSIDAGRVDRRPAGPGQNVKFLATGGLPLVSAVTIAAAGADSLPAYAASVSSCDLPKTVEAGGAYTASVRIRNDGSKTWKQGSASRPAGS